MKAFNVFNIKWDTDGAQVKLPKYMTVVVEDEEDIADAISDQTGYLHFSFEFRQLEETNDLLI